MLLAQNAIRDELKEKVEKVAASDKASDEVKAACQEYLDTFGIGALNGTATDKLVAALDGCECDTCKYIVKNKNYLAKKSQWIFGGDGWAYDIGFGHSLVHTLLDTMVDTWSVSDDLGWSRICFSFCDSFYSLLSLLRLVLLLSSQQAEKKLRRKTLLLSQ